MNQHAMSANKSGRMATLGEIMTLVNGRAYSQHELLDAGTPVVRIQNLNGGDRWYYSDLNLGPEKYCNQGDLLFAWSGTFGPYIWDGPKAIFHYHIWKIVPSDHLAPRYAYHLLRNITQAVKAAGRGISMLHMTKGGMEVWPVFLPPLDDQRRIAVILDKADALRQKRKSAITLLDSLTQSIFLDMFGSDLDPKVTLGEVTAEFRYGTSQKSGPIGYPTLRIPNVARGAISLDDLKTVEVDKKEFERLSLQSGDLLFVRTNGNRDYVGRSAVVDESLSAKSGMAVSSFIFASYLIRSRLTEGMVTPAFVQAYLSTDRGRASLLERSKTSAGQFNINTEGLASVPLPMPNIGLQREFESRIHKAQDRADTWLDSHRYLEDLFASLQHRAFSGQL